MVEENSANNRREIKGKASRLLLAATNNNFAGDLKTAAGHGKDRLMDLALASMTADDNAFNDTNHENRRITLKDLKLSADYEFMAAAGKDKINNGKSREITLSEKMAMIAQEYDGLAGKKGAFFEAVKEEFPERYGKTYINKTPENLREAASKDTASVKKNIISISKRNAGNSIA